MQLVTALEEARYETLWEMMNHIWNIEENGFHQLKTYYHAKHCYCHGASEAICSMLILDFNMKELYLYRRLQGFIKSRISRKSVSQIFCDDLQTEKVKYILHRESGQGLEMIRNLENRIIKKSIIDAIEAVCAYSFAWKEKRRKSVEKEGFYKYTELKAKSLLFYVYS